MMGHIFTAATRVIAYMYEQNGSEGVPEALDIIREFAFEGSTLRNILERRIPEIQQFLSHEYWTRRWIVQELALAKSIVFQYGSQTVTMGAVEYCLKNMEKRTFSDLRLGESMAYRICDLRAQKHAKCDAEDILKAYDDTDCTNPLDKVFALLSLMGRTGKNLRVDYQLGRIEMFFHVLDVAGENEDPNIVALGSLLRSNLELSADEMTAIPNGANENSKTALVLRYKITAAVPSNAIDQEVVQFSRGKLPALMNFEEFIFREGEDRMLPPESLIMESHELSHHGLNTVSAQDMQTFTYRIPSDLTEKVEKMGLATVGIKNGDFMFSFPGTPVALIARRSPNGISVIGRAFLLRSQLKSISNKSRQSFHVTTQAHNLLKDILDITNHEPYGKSRSYGVVLGPLELLQIVKWTSLDDRASHLSTLRTYNNL